MRSQLLRCLFIVIVFITSRPGVSQGQQYEDDACMLRNGGSGKCKNLQDCPGIMNALRSKIPLITCSYNQLSPIICCPIEQSQQTSSSALNAASPNLNELEPETPVTEGESCELETGAPGQCKTFQDCPQIRINYPYPKQPKICSFNQTIPIICCPIAQNEPSHDIQTTSFPFRRPPSNNAEQFRTTPSTRTTTTSPPLVEEAAKAEGEELPSNVGEKSATMCDYYSQFVFALIQSPSLTLDPEWFNQSQCASREYETNQKPIREVTEALFREYPHMARLGYGNEDDIAWLCSGSLISERFILTTAHCVSSPNSGYVRWARIADLTPTKITPDTTENRKVIEFLQYDGPAMTSDPSNSGVALLRLERDVEFNGLARPACLYSQPGNPPGHSFATSVGWGITDWNDTTSSERLMTKDLTLQTQCSSSSNKQQRSRRQLRTQSTSDARTICASDPFPGRSSGCVGDSGGPLQIMLETPTCMHSIVGLTTSGPKACADGTQSAVYIRVSSYISWIENHVWP